MYYLVNVDHNSMAMHLTINDINPLEHTAVCEMAVPLR
jgi:hypothetical protein